MKLKVCRHPKFARGAILRTPLIAVPVCYKCGATWNGKKWR